MARSSAMARLRASGAIGRAFQEPGTEYKSRAVRAVSPPPEQQQQKQQEVEQVVPMSESIKWGAAQGAAFDGADELYGLAKAVGISPGEIIRRLLSNPRGPALFEDQDLSTRLPEGDLPSYASARDEARSKDEAAQKNKKAYWASKVGAGVASSLVPMGVAVKGTAGAAKLVQAGKAGAAIGASSGLGASKADLTTGDVAGALADTATGALAGGVVGVVAQPIASVVGKGVGSAANKLLEMGRSRLFKAAVGHNKRAFTQINGKGLLDKAAKYLDDMGVGVGDSTESIAEKLSSRREAVGSAMSNTVSELDAAAGGKIAVDSSVVADDIMNKVAGPLKRLAAARTEYRQVIAEVKEIKKLGGLSFAEAAQQRAAMQKQVNYDSQNGRDILAQARRDMAKIWNQQIDKQAEPLLKNSGKAGDAYRELRHEFSLVEELLRHVNNRVQGNASKNWISPSDYGTGGIAGIMTGNPLVGVAAAAANHLGKNYGNASAGRAAIGMARMALGGGRAAESLLPPSLVGVARTTYIGQGEDEPERGKKR